MQGEREDGQLFSMVEESLTFGYAYSGITATNELGAE